MPHRLVFQIIFCWLMAGVAAAEPSLAEPASPDPTWPLDLSTRYLTSNFMEFRPGRFHAGLDLKTQSRMGFAVRAVEDGWILRVRSTPGAYGRAVYLRGESGKTYVYAHLMRYADRIRTLVTAEQERQGTYRARLGFQPGQIPVRRGEILGLSGQSGTAGPHLHFEVRDAKNRPVDPQSEGFAVNDTIAPGIFTLRAIPAGPSSLIEGEAVARSYSSDSGALRGDLPPLRVLGPVAFSARIVDRSDIRGHRLSPASITLKLDGQQVFVSGNIHYEFSQNSYQRLEWLETGGLRERWLHRHPADGLPGRNGELWYLGTDGDGLSPGVHRLELEAVDRAGNRGRVEWEMVVGDRAGSIVEAVAESPRHPGWEQDPVRLQLVDAASVDTVGYLTPFFDVLPEPPAGWEKLRFFPDDGDPVLAATTLMVQSAPLNSLVVGSAEEQGLEPVTGDHDPGGITFLAADWPIDAAVTVDLPATWPTERLADPRVQIYRLSGTNWRPAGRPLPPTGTGAVWRFSLSDPGTYSAFRDSVPPVLTAPSGPVIVLPAERSPYPEVTLGPWEVFAISVRDTGSEVDPASIGCDLDGRRLIVEPDLPRARILVELPAGLASGRHQLVIRVSDEAGNPTEKAIDLEIP